MTDFTKKIKITANTQEAETKLARLQVQLKEFGEHIERFQGQFNGVRNASSEFGEKLERLGLLSVFAEGGIVGLTNKIADVGYELGETAIKTGLTTAQLQYWQYVAKQSGLDTDTLTRAIGRLTVNIGMASRPTSEQAQAFKFLGISQQYLKENANDTNKVFIELMKRLGSVHDQTKRNLAAQLLFSRSYLELLPVMKQISSGSKENANDFSKYGFVLSESAIKQSEEFHRSSINLQTSLQSLGLQIGTQLIPILQPLIQSMADYTSENRKAIAADISNTILSIAHAFRDAYTTAKPVLTVIGNLVAQMGGLKTVILLVAGYLVADLAVSFVALNVQIVLATVSMFRFAKAALALEPVALTFAGIGAAVGLLVYGAIKLYNILKQIKETFDLKELLRELGAVGKIISSFVSGDHNVNVNAQSSQSNPFPKLSSVTSRPALPIYSRQNGASSAANNNNLNIHMKIDADGRPTIADVQSTSPISFTSQLGFLR